MELVKDLGIEAVTSKTGNTRNRRYGMFHCEYCNEDVKVDMYYGKKAKTCVKCRPHFMECKHHMSHTRPWVIWCNMKNRCNDPKNKNFHRYGGRGITYDRKWEDFTGFWEDMQEGYFGKGTLDREDNDGDYCKSNCQWITRKENSTKDQIKKVYQYEIEGKGKNIVYVRKIAEFESTIEAEEVTGIGRQMITRCARGDRRKTKGYGWRYADTK